MKGFRTFILRGNMIDLAVGVVVGGAFGAVVASLVKDLITPFIAVIVGRPDFSKLGFKIGATDFLVGDFINAVVAFLLVSAVIYFFVVLPVNTLMARAKRGEAPRPDHQKVHGVLKRHTHRRTQMRILYLRCTVEHA